MIHTRSISIPEFGNFGIRYYCHKSDEKYLAHSFPPHIHDELEIYLLIKGDVSFLVAGNLYKVQPYDVIISKPNEVHNCIRNSNSEHIHLCFWFTPCSDFLFADLLASGSSLLHPLETDRALLDALCARFFALPDDHTEPILEFSLCTELLAILHRALGSKGGVKSMLPDTLKQILKEIDRDPGNCISVSALSEKYFISQSSLDRMFRKYLRTTPKTYLDSKRLAYSRILLTEGMSVTEASMRAGFPDCSSYIRLFKKRFGVTPLAYRRRLSGGNPSRSQDTNKGE